MSIVKQTGAKTATGFFLHPAKSLFLYAPCFILVSFTPRRYKKRTNIRYKQAKNVRFLFNRFRGTPLDTVRT